jgi:dynein heavy chain
MNNQVPGLWKKVSYPSLRPLGSWFEDLIERCKFFDQWLNKGKPKAFWLPSFFFPQGFLTSILQNYARKNKVPIDVLDFSYDFLDFSEASKITHSSEEGAYIYGLYMEGCRFDYKQMRLEESKPGEMYVDAPVINFMPTEKYEPDKEDYTMPVYKTTTRAGVLSTTGHSTNFVIAIEVPTRLKPEHWILNGAAFVCQLND